MIVYTCAIANRIGCNRDEKFTRLGGPQLEPLSLRLRGRNFAVRKRVVLKDVQGVGNEQVVSPFRTDSLYNCFERIIQARAAVMYTMGVAGDEMSQSALNEAPAAFPGRTSEASHQTSSRDLKQAPFRNPSADASRIAPQ